MMERYNIGFTFYIAYDRDFAPYPSGGTINYATHGINYTRQSYTLAVL